MSTIVVTVAYLGGSRADAGCAREELTLPFGSRLEDLVREVTARHPRLAPHLPHVRWARNFELARLDEQLTAGDEIGLLPPVCGGASRAELTREPVDPRQVIARVASDEAGATVVFVGTVRRHSHGHGVERIDYEAYQPMAERQLERVAGEVAAEHGALDVHIVHRHGTVPVGEVAVAIAASAVHRQGAFAACRAAIERIKEDVPIWKREVGEDGERWEGWGGG